MLRSALALAAVAAVAGTASPRHDAALFTADDGHGRASWCTDGTAGGTIRVWDFVYARQHRLCGLKPLPVGYVYADDGELWRVDGTTRHALDVPRLQGLSFDVFARVGSITYLTVNEQGRTGLQLWRTDGTAAGTFRLTYGDSLNLPGPRWFATVGDTLYFEGPGLKALWRTDGTLRGTWIVYPRDPDWLVAAGRTLYFVSGKELWTSDGTRGGTKRVLAIPYGDSVNSGPAGLVALGHFVYFWTLRVGTFVLWRSDGTRGGTIRLKTFVDEGPEDDLYVVGGRVVISAVDGIWTTNGTPAGTVKVAAAVASPSWFTAFRGAIFFRAYRRVGGRPEVELWRTDLTRAGTRFVHLLDVDVPYTKSDLIVAGRTLYLSIWDRRHGLELWKSDGTAAGTVLVKDLRPGPAGSDLLFDHGG